LFCKEGHKKGWKIADPGFAKFVKEGKARKHDGLPVIKNIGGTTEYGMYSIISACFMEPNIYQVVLRYKVEVRRLSLNYLTYGPWDVSSRKQQRG